RLNVGSGRTRAVVKHGDVIVWATTACLRARLRTAPIRSRERQRADAQLLMTFCLARARAQLPRFVAVVEHQVRQSDGQRNESQQGDARRRAMCLGGPVLLDDLLGLVERNVEVLASRFNSPPGRVEVGRGSWPQQLTKGGRGALILSSAFRQFLGGKVIGSTGRLADATG